MSIFKDHCVEETDAPSIKFQERGKSIIFENDKRRKFQKIVVDGCQILDGARCDYLLVDKKTGDEYFVELKGMDVGHALEQLDRSIKQLSDLRNKTKTTRAFIISSSCSPRLTSKIQRYKKAWKCQYNASLDVKERHYKLSV